MTKWILLFVVVFSVSCQKESRYNPMVYSKVYVHFVNRYQSQPLVFNAVNYQTCDSSLYSVKRLDYLLGDIKLHRTDKYYPLSHLIKTTKDSVLLIDSVRQGALTSIGFTFGVNPALLNESALNAIQEMYWPESMGGGYHYMKMDGHFQDTADVMQGFSMHAGSTAIAPVPVSLPLNAKVTSAEHHLYVGFSVYGLMNAASCYSFIQDGNYTMMNPASMSKLMNNAGQSFSVISFK